jgi:hypothetical protein
MTEKYYALLTESRRGSENGKGNNEEHAESVHFESWNWEGNGGSWEVLECYFYL